MLLPLIRDAELETREPPPYARWGAVTGELRADLEREPGRPGALLLEYLEGIEPAHHAEALQDLIAEHLRLTWRRGGRILLEAYVRLFGARFEVLARTAALPAELIEDEFLARCALPGGDAPALAEYERRFPGRPEALAPLRRRLLGERYVKLTRLGRGAAGEVWEARDRRAEQLVAIKQLRPEWAEQPQVLDSFAREAAITASLDHPGIVPVLEFVREPDSAPYLVMGLVRGRPLSDLIGDYHHPKLCRTRREKRELWHGLLDAFETLCAATAHAHSRGVLHRDLKPGNVRVEPGGAAVILDWGLATRVHDAAREEPTDAIGTPECMAPEQVEGRADERSDVFGLGAILHELLTGRPLRTWATGTRPPDWKRVVLERPLIPPRRLNARVPRDLERLCQGTLALDPDQRPASAMVLLRGLREHREGGAPSAGNSLLRHSRRLLRRAGLDRIP